MKQIVQDIQAGKLEVATLPDPIVGPNEVLIENRASLISIGTERSLRKLAKKSLLAKARERPDQVRRVLEKARQEGIARTVQQVRTKLGESMPLGYSSSGVVRATGEQVRGFQPGDRVASNGAHASVVAVPQNLCAHVPEAVDHEAASFAVVSAIALQGVRLANLGLGDRVYVIGLGLIGQITVSLLRSAGCRVIASDLAADRCEMAKTRGAEVAGTDVDGDAVTAWTGGLGADAVIITASTPSNGPIDLAARAVRQKGRIVAVGLVGLELPRRELYPKEAEVVISCSYGPGRYDANYEDRGLDYPAAYVRWTEQRNIQAALDLMAEGALPTNDLVSHRFAIDDAQEAYRLAENDAAAMAIVLQYEQQEQPTTAVELRPAAPPQKITIGMIGAGGFAKSTLAPAIRKSKTGKRLKSVASAKGLSARDLARAHGIEQVATDPATIFEDGEINTVFVMTRHNLHVGQVRAGLEAGKHVFVEKPLATTKEDLHDLANWIGEQSSLPVLMVGFNRRFSPAAELVRRHFAHQTEPLTVMMRINAGSIPADHWVHDPEEGGGRVIGEACHFIDLATSLTGATPVRVFAQAAQGAGDRVLTEDRCVISLMHANGSVTSITYTAGGDRALAKELIEVHGAERSAVIDDFRRVDLYAGGRRKTKKLLEQDKGHQAEIDAFLSAIDQAGASPIPLDELLAVSAASILATHSLRSGTPETIAEWLRK